jgi:hypothetical protein
MEARWINGKTFTIGFLWQNPKQGGTYERLAEIWGTSE